MTDKSGKGLWSTLESKMLLCSNLANFACGERVNELYLFSRSEARYTKMYEMCLTTFHIVLYGKGEGAVYGRFGRNFTDILDCATLYTCVV